MNRQVLSSRLEQGRLGLVRTVRRRSFWVYALITLYLVGFHLRLSLATPSGATLLPMYPMLVAAAGLALLHAGQIIRRARYLLLTVVVFVLVQPFLSRAGGSGPVDSLTSSVQLAASIVAFYAVVHAASLLPREGLRRYLLGFWACLMGLAVLETYALRPAFRVVQEFLYAQSGRGIYTEDLRDTLLYGKVRPSVLASEPSFLADSWMALMVAVFLLDRRRGSAGSWARLAVMTAVGFTLAPSMKIVFYLAALALFHFWPQRNRWAKGVLAGATVAGLVMVTFFTGWMTSAVGSLAASQSGSFFARITVAPEVAREALARHPIVGYGIGNYDGVTPLAQGVWEREGALERFYWYVGFGAQDLMTNGFWWMWISMGIVGGLAFAAIVWRLLTTLGVDRPMRTLACVMLVWYSGFAYVDPASWFIVVLFALPSVVRTCAPTGIGSGSTPAVEEDGPREVHDPSPPLRPGGDRVAPESNREAAASD